jgi:hypothetical protein
MGVSNKHHLILTIDSGVGWCVVLLMQSKKMWLLTAELQLLLLLLVVILKIFYFQSLGIASVGYMSLLPSHTVLNALSVTMTLDAFWILRSPSLIGMCAGDQ